MRKRLQVLFSEQEMRKLREAARESGLTVSEYVRRALRAAQRESAGPDVGAKLECVRAAARHELPAADIDRMLNEIERGYGRAPE